MPKKKTLKSRSLDNKDKKILTILQEDGRMSLTKISKKVNLSIDSVHNRMKEMKRKGIYKPSIMIEPRKIGFPLIADCKIKLKNISQEEREEFINYLKNQKRCTELLAVMGDYDFTCVLIAKDSNDFEEISTKIRQKFKEQILEWKSILVLKTYKFEEYGME